jgi:hypothetical protein
MFQLGYFLMIFARLLWSRAIYSAAAIMFYGYYGRARASARSDHYVFALFFRIPFLFFLFFFIFYYFFSLSRNL